MREPIPVQGKDKSKGTNIGTSKLLGLSKAQDSEQEKYCEMKLESQTRLDRERP